MGEDMTEQIAKSLIIYSLHQLFIKQPVQA